MPVLPPNTINDVPKSIRNTLKALLHERSLIGYTFSFERLLHHFAKVGVAHDSAVAYIQESIVAWKDSEAKAVKETLNERITNIYTEHGIDKTLRDTDPFGRSKDYIMMEGVSTSFSKDKALQIAVAGVYKWRCGDDDCNTVNYTPQAPPTTPAEAKKNKTVCCSCGATSLNRPAKLVSFDAEALMAVFALATKTNKYVSLQARDVKDDDDL
jgi:hypothetical protein